MRLEKDASAGGANVTVSCYECGKRFTLSRGWADLDGPAFVAYVCQRCAGGAKYADAPRTINGYTLKELEAGGGYGERWERAWYALREGV